MHPSLNFESDDQLCTSCRKRVAELPEELQTVASSQSEESVLTEEQVEAYARQALPGTSSDKDDMFISPDHEISVLNASLSILGESPIIKRKLDTRALYVKEKVRKIESTVRKKIEISIGCSISDKESETESPEIEMINQLKEKMQSCTRKSDKIQILTILPKSWTRSKVVEEFQVSEYMVRTAKKLVSEKGIMSTPNPRLGKLLPKTTVDLIKTFYHSDEISRIMPGKKDYVSVTVCGMRQHLQKRLILCNLKEAYQQFKDGMPDVKIGFSKFSELRPKECILAGAGGTHSVCVCTVHQNVKLMFVGAKLDQLSEGCFKSYQHCLAAMHCNPPQVECYFGGCDQCPGAKSLQEKLEIIFDKEMIDQVSNLPSSILFN